MTHYAANKTYNHQSSHPTPRKSKQQCRKDSLQFLILFAILISLFLSQFQQSPAYLGVVSNATKFPPKDYYDYIIVGGGTTGCPLAATLSEGFRVLVLEGRGGGIPFGVPNLMSRNSFLTTLMEVDAHDSPAQAFTSEDGVPNARGRVLGGSRAINAGFYSKANPGFYAKLGIDWDLRMVGIDPYHGFSLDHSIGTKIDDSTFDSTGTRHSAADLLGYGNPRNLKVVVQASVEKRSRVRLEWFSMTEMVVFTMQWCVRMAKCCCALGL
ncbi:(R)-mandelonitrile lyase [Salvia divinorum]|uniref:(R)-mandelonitrile lyase n=1 Tax=Salvia divinorum TaxID=28513 RepID=A0ABD1HRS3_SALDI